MTSSTEIDRYDSGREPAPVAHLTTVEMPRERPSTAMERTSDFTTWVERLRAAGEVAAVVARTEFVPKALRGNEAAVTAAILAGAEMNLAPMTALNHVYIIEGRPSLSAEMGRALVLAHGHEIEWEETTTERVVVYGRRRNERSWAKVTWTMDDARRAKLAGKDVWQKHPRRMLTARASSELCRLKFGDCMAGMSYSSEELQDDADDSGVSGTVETEAEKPTAQRARAPKASSTSSPRRRSSSSTPATPEPPSRGATAGPPLPGEDEPAAAAPKASSAPAADEVVVEDGEKPSQQMMRKLFALIREAKLGDRNAYASHFLGREVTSFGQLNARDVNAMIDNVEAMTAADDEPAAAESGEQGGEQQTLAEPAADDASSADS